MKLIYFFAIAILLSFSVSAQTVLWFEDFEDEADGAQTQNGATVAGSLGGTWSVTVDPGGSFERVGVLRNSFFIDGNTGEGEWRTNTVTTSGTGYVQLDLTIGAAGIGFDDDDYVECYYVVDGGSEVLFMRVEGDFVSNTIQASAIIPASSSIQLIVRGRDDSFFGALDFDDVTISSVSVLYSRKSGTWTDVTAGNGTWSTVSHSGASCDCLPLTTMLVIIGDNDVVTLPSSQSVGGVDIFNTGTLQYNTNATTLTISRGYFRSRSGATVNSSGAGITGEQISFNADVVNAQFQIDAGSTVSVEDLVFGTASAETHYITGGGTLNISDDLLIQSGLTLYNNSSGTMSISDDINLTGDNATFSNTPTGTFSLTGSIDFNAGAQGNDITNSASFTFSQLAFNDDNNTFTNSGNITMNAATGIFGSGAGVDDNIITNSAGGVMTFGAIDPTSGDMDIFNYGTINQSGNFSNITTTDTNIDNLATGVWNWSYIAGTATDTDLPTVSDFSTAGNIFNYNANTGTQSVMADTYYHLRFTGTGINVVKRTLGNIDVNGNLTIEDEAQLDIDNGDDNITLAGNWTVTSSNGDPFVEGNGTTAELVTFDGSSGNQTITNPNGETFQRLTINKTSGNVILANNVTLRNTTQAVTEGFFTQGLLITSSSALFIVSDDATTTVGNANSYVDGPMRKLGNNTYTFPLGDGVYWARLTFTPTGADNNTVLNAEYTSSVYSDVDLSGLTSISAEYWTVSQSGTLTSAVLTLFWESGTRSGITNIGGTDLRVARYNGSAWVDGGRGTVTGSTTTGSIQSAAITAANLSTVYTFGANSGVNPLPVELASFDVTKVNDEVEVKWTTATEFNNDYFVIERSRDAEQFDEIERIAGHGTSSGIHHYKTTDTSPLHGRSYYRLRQTDFDGTTTYSPIKSITFEGLTRVVLRAYPNPNEGNDVHIQVKGIANVKRVPIQFFNQHGEKVYETTIATDGASTVEINLSILTLPKGFYIIRAGNTPELTQKFVIH